MTLKPSEPLRRRWIKKGHIFAPDGTYDWMASHAQLPVVDSVDENVLRVYFGTRDRVGRSVVTSLDVDANDLGRIVRLPDRPVLGLGELGCFDDSGVMPSCIVRQGDRRLLYYLGFNTSTTVPYRISIGL